MMESMTTEFDDIRPYTDSEISDAMERIVSNPYFAYVVKFLYPDVPVEAVKSKFRSFNSVNSFQVNVMDYAIQNIVKSSSSGLSYSGFENLVNSKRYLFLSNHRDILLDSAILQIVLHANKHEPSEITFGDNLMESSGFIVDIGRSNKMFKLIRGGSPRQIFINSLHTSRYIRYAINEKHESIWIAQRNGRSKDGNDQTQPAVLKMFAMSGERDFVHDFAELNIAPVVISYEFDPGDFLKTREIYISRRQPYIKTKDEDIKSIINGIKQFKGKIHLAVAPPVSEEELLKIEETPKNERIQNLAKLIDRRVYEKYRLWNNNYIAYDLLHGNLFENIYSKEERTEFKAYMNKMLSKIEGDKDELESIFLGIYANPVVNHIKINGIKSQLFTDKITKF
jgi:hypothetical protein